LKKRTVQVKIDQLTLMQSERRSWNGVNPVTRIIPNKKRYNRNQKHRNINFE